MIEVRGKYTNARVMIDSIDEETMSQITQFVNHPAFTNQVAIMSDTHAGKGCVIGFTMPMTSKIIPNVIGVDIGCGMLSLNLGKTLPMSLDRLDAFIRARIPFGTDVHDQSFLDMREFPWHKANVLAEKFIMAYSSVFNIHLDTPRYDMDWFTKKCRDTGADLGRAIKSIGTLGGGNHFLETGLSGQGDYWFTIHSGSRNFGKHVCDYWQDCAVSSLRQSRKVNIQEEIEKIKKETSDGKEIYRRIKELKAQAKEHNTSVKSIKSNGLEWLDGDAAIGYLYDMIFAQVYAEVNRACMGRIVCDILKIEPVVTIETIHNYIDFKDFIVRKGAIRAYIGEQIIIPFNMRDGILLCEGKSNQEWNCSAPHGAGRVLSRGQARRQLNLETFKKQMEGIYSISVGRSTLDESPDAYKDSKLIEQAIEPTVTILDHIKPLQNMKDSSEADRD